MQKVFVTLVVCVALVAGAWYWSQHKETVTTAEEEGQTQDLQQLTIGDTTLFIEVAATQDAQTRGLSGRAGLPDNTGLWFPFDYDGFHGIWMKDMRFSIDIIWLDKELRIVTIIPGADPSSYPTIFTPSREARYVLEVPAGFAAQHHIEEGGSASFGPQSVQ